MRLDPEILDGPPETGARILALARLADAEDAAARLDAKEGGVHGFVEALRRLESTLEALAPALAGAVSGEPVKALRAARGHAALAREAERLSGWLQGIRADLAGPYRGALDWLADRVDRRRRAAGEELAAEAATPFRRLAPRLARDLSRRRASQRRAGTAATFGVQLAGLIRARARALREALGAVAGAADAPGLERASAEADRLRDLIEPLGGSGPRAAEALAALEPLAAGLRESLDARAAQDGLEGALLEARADEVRRGAAALAGLRPGLLAVLGLAERRAADRSRRIEAALASKGTPVTDAAYAVVGALEAGAGEEEAAAASAPERRFLLTAIPPEGRGGDVEEVEQGWLPGEGRESIGCVRGPRSETWFRERGASRGAPSRVEQVSRAEFESFWPLTEGRRVARRRHSASGLPGWRFDEYLDRALVVAVGEAVDLEPAPPPWLEPVLVREITGERGYLDEALARRPPRRTG
jgi:hypothetical protein